MKSNFNVLFWSPLFALMVSCSSGPAVVEYPPTASSIDEIRQLDAELTEANAQQVDVLSPDNFKRARSALSDAQERQAKGEDPAKTLHLVAVGHAYLNRANETAKLAHSNIDDVVSARQRALNAGAATYLAKDLKKADDHLTDVTADLENNDTESAAKKRAELQAEYLGIELNTIKQAHLDSAKQTIERAKKEGAEKYAPRSLAIAEKKLIDTDAFITGNRHADAEVKSRAEDATLAADHVLKITRDAKLGKNVTGEDAALAMEDEQNKATAARSELAMVGAELGSKEAEIAAKEEQLKKEKAQTEAALQQKEQLESEKLLNARYEAAQKQFSKNEAEVYKQDNKLVIRLRGLEFARSRADIKREHFRLLKKVQNVIKEFPQSSIVIEGYTDSDGSKEANKKLSENRAAAVKEYFVESAGIDEKAITAVGYGDLKPLAPNNSKIGKAQNRRVDVVITPTGGTL